MAVITIEPSKQDVTQAIKTSQKQISKIVKSGVDTQVANMGPKASNVVKAAKTSMFDELTKFASDVYKDFSSGVKHVWLGVKSAVYAAVDMMYNMIMGVYQMFREVIRALGAMFKWIWDKLVELKKYIVDTIKKIWNSISDWWNGKDAKGKGVKTQSAEIKKAAPTSSIFENRLEMNYKSFLEAEDNGLPSGRYVANLAKEASMVKKCLTVLGVSLVCLVGGYFIYRQSKKGGRSAIMEATNTDLRCNYLLNEIETGNVVLEGAYDSFMSAITWPFKNAYPKAAGGLAVASNESTVPAAVYVLIGGAALTFIIFSSYIMYNISQAKAMYGKKKHSEG